jgi:hypothetical protein
MQRFTKCLKVIFWVTIGAVHSQSTVADSVSDTPKLYVGGYLDMYYGVAGGQEGDVPYFVSMSRSNELNINLAFIDIKYTSDDFRARFAPALGTFMNANYAAEPGTLKNILEASAGFRLSESKNIWIDAGVLGSPYTNESPISRDQLMYTRSFAPEYVPYYLSGIKLGVPLSEQLTAYVYLINGWQQIADLNRAKSLGTQLEWKPNDKHLLNWNTYIGDEYSSAAPNNRMRYFTDVYWLYHSDNAISFTTCLYVGNQKRHNSANQLSNNYWWQANFIARYRFSEQVSLSGRIEYFSDPNSVQISPLNSLGGFSSYSGGLCLNLQVHLLALFRIEGRHFFSDKQVYEVNNKAASQMTWLIAGMTIQFPN